MVGDDLTSFVLQRELFHCTFLGSCRYDVLRWSSVSGETRNVGDGQRSTASVGLCRTSDIFLFLGRSYLYAYIVLF